MRRPSRHPLYQTWAAMKARCLTPHATGFKNYGGRGVSICARWMNFASFAADMGRRPAGMTLDRIDNDGNYEPGNCRWASPSDQRRNGRGRGERVNTAVLKEADVRDVRRRSAAGESQTALARAFGIRQSTVSSIVRRLTWRHVA